MSEKKKYTLLVVDDEPIISDGLKDLFEEEFPEVFQIYNCYHPKKALELFRFRCGGKRCENAEDDRN